MKRLPFSCYTLIITILLLLPGCTRYACWVSDVFNQGRKTTLFPCLAERYVRSLRMYDQLETLGNFDGLWLHEEVREAYLEAHASLKCLDSLQAQRLLHYERLQARHTIAFYLLATTPHNYLLTDATTEWSVHLVVDEVCFNPVELKVTHLSPEYIRIFGPWFNKFKQIYLIKFNAQDAQGMSLITENTTQLQLIFKRLGHEGVMTWCLDENGRALVPLSFNKDILAYDINNNF